VEEIKKVLSALSKEELLSLCASLLFSTLVNLATLNNLVKEFDKQ
jgi:hypothetical protein